MTLTLEQYAAKFPDRSPPVPGEFAGQWISWNEERSAILSHGTDFNAVRQEAIALGCARPILQKIPRGPFVGGA